MISYNYLSVFDSYLFIVTVLQHSYDAKGKSKQSPKNLSVMYLLLIFGCNISGVSLMNYKEVKHKVRSDIAD